MIGVFLSFILGIGVFERVFGFLSGGVEVLGML